MNLSVASEVQLQGLCLLQISVDLIKEPVFFNRVVLFKQERLHLGISFG